MGGVSLGEGRNLGCWVTPKVLSPPCSDSSDVGIGHAPTESPPLLAMLLQRPNLPLGVPWGQLPPWLSQCCCLLPSPLVSCSVGRLLCLRGGDCAVQERGQHPLPAEVRGAAWGWGALGDPSGCRALVLQGKAEISGCKETGLDLNVF